MKIPIGTASILVLGVVNGHLRHLQIWIGQHLPLCWTPPGPSSPCADLRSLPGLRCLMGEEVELQGGYEDWVWMDEQIDLIRTVHIS